MKPTPEQVYATIEAATIPAGPVFYTAGTLREQGMGERTRAIRKLLKYVGIKGISVRQATGSMCFWTYVDLPRLYRPAETGVLPQPERDAIVIRENAARQKVEAIILAAFPDLDDRSDAYTDYSDFVFMVGFQ